MNLPAQDSDARAVQEVIHQHWVFFLVQGLVMAVLGLMAMAEPIFATVAADIFVGWLFWIVGVASLVRLYMQPPVIGLWPEIIASLLSISISGYLIWRPFGSVISLTLAAAVFFCAQGVSQLILAIAYRAVLATWAWVLLSSLINCSLAVVALSGPWDTFVWALGLMFGINLLMWGLALVIIALTCRSTAAGPGQS
jgi:uncharacterized membrane protein HdeD (DUF308 family)